MDGFHPNRREFLKTAALGSVGAGLMGPRVLA